MTAIKTVIEELETLKEFIAQFKCEIVSLQQIKDKYLIDGSL